MSTELSERTALRLCSHLATGEQHTHIQRGNTRFCLDCAAGMYERDKDPRLASIYYQVIEGRAMKARARR